MIIENRKASRNIKRVFSFGGILYMAMIGLFYYLDNKALIIVFCIFLFLDLLCFSLLNFHYIHFTIEKNKLILRYYPVISFWGKKYQSIEFPVKALYAYDYNTSFSGIYPTLRLTVKTPKGMASYPKVVLSGLTPEKRTRLKAILNNLIKQNHGQQPLL